MVRHGLVCKTLEPLATAHRTVTASSAPDKAKLREIYLHNLKHTQTLIQFCVEKNIFNLRLSSDLFPLWSHKDYKRIAAGLLSSSAVLEAMFAVQKAAAEADITLSVHPDQFILLSSQKDYVNANGVYELGLWGSVAERMGISLINIHGGPKSGGKDFHFNTFAKNFDKLPEATQVRLSIENDEKCYGPHDVLELAQRVGAKALLDFHHNRVHYLMHRVKSASDWSHADEEAESLLGDFASTYGEQIPHFHLSSPRGGWVRKFNLLCPHADLIDVADVPMFLYTWSKRHGDVNLDVEAKSKEVAIADLRRKVKRLAREKL